MRSASGLVLPRAWSPQGFKLISGDLLEVLAFEIVEDSKFVQGCFAALCNCSTLSLWDTFRPHTSHSSCPLMVLAQHLLHSLASIFTVSGFCACSSLLRRDFVTKDFDLAADLDDGKPGGGVTDPALAALAGGAFGAGSKNTAAEDATAIGFGSLVKAAFFLAGCSSADGSAGFATALGTAGTGGFGASPFGGGGNIWLLAYPGHFIKAGGGGLTFPGNFGSAGMPAADPAGVVENKLCNFSLASAAKSVIAMLGMGVAPAFALADFGVANISNWTSPGPWSISSILSLGALYLVSFSTNSSTLSWSWKLSSAACNSCLLHSSLISWITDCSSCLNPSMPCLAYSTVSSTIFFVICLEVSCEFSVSAFILAS